MRLMINGDQVSYALENEKTLGEVVRGVRQWLAAAGFVITAMAADKRDLLQSSADAWGTAGVQTVGTLAVAAAHTGDMKIAHWRTVETWLGMLEEEIGRAAVSAEDPLEDLLEGLPQTLEGFRTNAFLPPGSDAGTRFAETFTGTGARDIRAWPPEKRRGAVELVREMRGHVRTRLEASRRPAESLSRCVQLLRGCMGELKEVSVLLQTGWYRFTKRRYGEGRRIFLMAPLHHHFEKKGWYESQVVMRFYILCVLFAVVALSALKIR